VDVFWPGAVAAGTGAIGAGGGSAKAVAKVIIDAAAMKTNGSHGLTLKGTEDKGRSGCKPANKPLIPVMD
jgi:hypothetical protein